MSTESTSCMDFDILIIAIGFGLEKSLNSVRVISYWEDDALNHPLQRGTYIVLGAGDGGLTDALRLCLRDFNHAHIIEDTSQFAATCALGRRLLLAGEEIEARLARGAISQGDAEAHHSRLYEQEIECDPQLLEYLQARKVGERPIFIHDRDGRLYQRRASTLNKLLVRHVVELGLLRWHGPVEAPDSKNETILSDGQQAKVLTRIGTHPEIMRLFPAFKVLPAPSMAGRRLGSERFFKANYFSRPVAAKTRRTVLVFTAASPGKRNEEGSGCSGELRHIRRLTEEFGERHDIHVNWQCSAYVPHLLYWWLNLLKIRREIKRHHPHVILVLGSDFAPVFCADSVPRWMRWVFGWHTHLVALAGKTPLIVFGASFDPDERDLMRSPHHYFVGQDPDLAGVWEAMKLGFPDKTIEVVCGSFYLVDVVFTQEFMKFVQKLREERRQDGAVRVRLRRIFFGAWQFHWLARGLFTPRAHRSNVVYAGRYLAHWLGPKLMRRYPFLSSFHADLAQGALVAYDTPAEPCARKITTGLLFPLLLGKEPRSRIIRIEKREHDIDLENAARHGIRIGAGLIKRANLVANNDAVELQDFGERVRIRTLTRQGRALLVRELRWRDAMGVLSCIKAPGFSYPYLTGNLANRPRLSALWRASGYVLRAMAARVLARPLFGARRHWILAIEDHGSGNFLGAVVIDELVRAPHRRRFGDRFLRGSEMRLKLAVGDAELGIFLHPQAQSQGVASQALYVVMDRLARTRGGSDSQGLLRRVYAETAHSNESAQRLLMRLGFERREALTVPATVSERYSPQGEALELWHYEQPAQDGRSVASSPVLARLAELRARGIVDPVWVELGADR